MLVKEILLRVLPIEDMTLRGYINTHKQGEVLELIATPYCAYYLEKDKELTLDRLIDSYVSEESVITGGGMARTEWYLCETCSRLWSETISKTKEELGLVKLSGTSSEIIKSLRHRNAELKDELRRKDRDIRTMQYRINILDDTIASSDREIIHLRSKLEEQKIERSKTKEGNIDNTSDLLYCIPKEIRSILCEYLMP